MIKDNKVTNYGPLLIAVASILWSLDGLLRRSLYVLPPLLIVTLEHVFGLIVLALFAKVWLPEIQKIDRRTWSIAGVIGLFSGLLGTLFYTAALGQVQYIQYSVVVLLQQTEPLFVMITSALFLKEKFKKNFMWWFILAMIGAYLISFKDLVVNFSAQTGTFYAALLALGAAFCWGSTTVLSKLVLNKTTPLTATVMRFLLTSIFGLVTLVITGGIAAVSSITSTQLLILVAITLSTGMVALAIYYYGLNKIPAKVATLFELIWPASALLIDIVVFNSSFSLTQVLGLAILATALYQVRKPDELIIQK